MKIWGWRGLGLDESGLWWRGMDVYICLMGDLWMSLCESFLVGLMFTLCVIIYDYVCFYGEFMVGFMIL